MRAGHGVFFLQHVFVPEESFISGLWPSTEDGDFCSFPLGCIAFAVAIVFIHLALQLQGK
jgi:hypothetical protein